MKPNMRILLSLLLLFIVCSCASTHQSSDSASLNGFSREDNSIHGQFRTFGHKIKNFWTGDGFFDSDLEEDHTDYSGALR